MSLWLSLVESSERGEETLRRAGDGGPARLGDHSHALLPREQPLVNVT